ncbi:hypothetical protein [Streptomyces sp. HUAS TT7]|uniref:hypothetical protein n=1 Tax=Streptomyces sp. HUAS TT7 TaxID=3447507 RepID=UPI003F65DDEB
MEHVAAAFLSERAEPGRTVSGETVEQPSVLRRIREVTVARGQDPDVPRALAGGDRGGLG